MTATELLADLRRAGVVLSAKGAKLAYDAPAGVLTPHLRASMATYKAELLALLASPTPSPALADTPVLPDMPVLADPLAPATGGRAGVVPSGIVHGAGTERQQHRQTCSQPCKPPPNGAQQPHRGIVPQADAAELRDLCLAQAERHGYPSVPIRPSERVMAGADAWRLFTERASLRDVVLALVAMDDLPRIRSP